MMLLFLIFFCTCFFVDSGEARLMGVRVSEASDGVMQAVRDGNLFKIDFGEPVLTVSSDNIQIAPHLDYYSSLSANRKVLTIVAGQGYDPQADYSVTVKNIYGPGGMLVSSRNITFSKNMDTYGGEDGSNIDFPDGEEDHFGEVSFSADRFQVPVSSQVKADYHPPAYIAAGKYIDVSIAHQVMTLFENGVEKQQFLISSGKNGMPTPFGTFAVQRKEENHWSAKYKLWMPYSLNITGGYYIHELPYWPNGYREGENHLGVRVSHGCVRLGIGPAKYVFDWAPVGTPIYIHK